MIARSMIEESCGRISPGTSGRTQKARLPLLSLGRRVEVHIESEFRECLERYGEEDAVFIHPGVIAYHSPERSHPGRQIAVNRIALLFEDAGRSFILFLKSNTPVIVDAIISSDDKQTSIVEERIAVQ